MSRRMGMRVTSNVAQSIEDIHGTSQRVGVLVEEIASASKEQALGIDLVSKAIEQINSVTQSNAANAEEAASASEELSAQAAELKDMVGSLVALVGGEAEAQAPITEVPRSGGGARHRRQRPERRMLLPQSPARVMGPEAVVPWDDTIEDF